MTQLDPPVHALPQRPQWVLLVCTFVQTLLQMVWPVGHWHTPPAQVAPAPQFRPQAPQLVALVCRLMQLPLQRLVPDGQLDVQLPATQA